MFGLVPIFWPIIEWHQYYWLGEPVIYLGTAHELGLSISQEGPSAGNLLIASFSVVLTGATCEVMLLPEVHCL